MNCLQREAINYLPFGISGAHDCGRIRFGLKYIPALLQASILNSLLCFVLVPVEIIMPDKSLECVDLAFLGSTETIRNLQFGILNHVLYSKR